MRKILWSFLFLIPVLLHAQDRETDFGASLSLELQKDLTRRFALSIEEELRLLTNNHDIGFERNMFTLGLDYRILDKKLKLGAYYCYIYLYNNDFYYEHRHRYFLSLSYKHVLDQSFTLTWRGRFQGTLRDENRGSYRVNPKYVLRNRIDLEYTIFGSPWRPSVSADFAVTTNEPRGNELYRIRYQAGVNWRLNRTDSMDFFLRMDHYLVDKDPNVISIGVGYQIDM